MPDGHTPDRKSLRSTLIWASRWLLLGANEHYRGGIKVTISSQDGSESVQFREDAGAADRVPSAFRQRAEEGLIEFLIRSFLSEEEEKIVRVLAEGTKKGAVLIDRAKIERSRAYVLFSNLSDRGLIRSISDGYELCSETVSKVLEMRERREEDAE